MTKARDLANIISTGVPNSLITLDANEIPNLDTAKVTTGAFADARIPNLSTDKLTSGTLSDARIADLSATKLTGSIADARVPASAVTQHVTATDLTPVRQDILTLGLKQAVNENSTKFNLTNSAITKFEADADFNLAGSTTVARNASEYISAYSTSTATDYDQTLSKTRSVVTQHTGGWTNAITNDSISRALGSGGQLDYPSYYANWIYDLATDWKIKIFIVDKTNGAQAYENYQTWNTIVTTDTSVASGADTATDTVDGRVFRQKDASSGSSDYTLEPTEWKTSTITSAYGTTIGTDGATDNYENASFGHQQINCASGSIHMQRCYAYAQNSYGWLVEYDRTANTITIKCPTNTAFTTFGSNYTTYSNVPETGRFIFAGGSGGSSTSNWYSTTMASVADADKGYAVTTVASIPATGTALGTTNVPTSAVTDVSGVMLLKNNAGTNTLGTDVKVYFTANNSAWTEATSYADAGTFSTGIKMIKLGKTTCTSGSDVRWKVVYANQSASKEAHIYGIGLNY